MRDYEIRFYCFDKPLMIRLQAKNQQEAVAKVLESIRIMSVIDCTPPSTPIFGDTEVDRLAKIMGIKK